MKPSTLLFAALCVALLAVSATAWPYYPRPHPHFPFPGSALPPKPSLPPKDDVEKCMHAVHHGGSLSCSPLGYNAGNCCEYLTGLVESCAFVPYYESSMFKRILRHVCDSGSSASPPRS